LEETAGLDADAGAGLDDDEAVVVDAVAVAGLASVSTLEVSGLEGAAPEAALAVSSPPYNMSASSPRAV
jgi:hypothetical protein